MLGDVLVSVLSRLDPRDIGPARAVSRAWRDAAAAALPHAFVRKWRLAGVTAAEGAPPRRGGFLEAAGLHSFVRVHRVARGDSFLSLAVRYGVQPAAIKRVNGMISDHSLHSRAAVLVPLVSAEQLEGRKVVLRYDHQAKRDVAVVLGPGADDEGEEGDPLAARRRAPALDGQAEALRLKMGQLLGRSMRVDAETALFYIDEAGGDLKAAISAAEADATWEDATPEGRPIRIAPVQRWIAGELGF